VSNQAMPRPRTRTRKWVAIQIDSIEVCNLEFSAGGWLQRLCEIWGARIVEIDAGDREIGLGLFRLFLEGNNACGRLRIRPRHRLRIRNAIGKGPTHPPEERAGLKLFSEAVAVKDIVAQHKA